MKYWKALYKPLAAINLFWVIPFNVSAAMDVLNGTAGELEYLCSIGAIFSVVLAFVVQPIVYMKFE